MAVGLDSNFRQDVWVCHFHGYGIGALFPPVSMKLENVCVCWVSLLSCMGGRVQAVVGSTESQGLLSGSHFGGSGNRDKKGSEDDDDVGGDDDDDDGGTWTVPNDLLEVFRLLF